MKLSELKSAPPVSQGVPPSSPGAIGPPEPCVEAPQEVQYVTSVTPSGIEVAYSASPRRHYRLRSPERPNGSHNFDWREVPSVTNVLGVLEKPQLVWWGMKVGVEGMLKLFREGWLRQLEDVEVFYDILDEDSVSVSSERAVDLLTEHKLTVNHQRDKAADRGVNVHGALEQWVGGKTISPEVFEEHERGYVEGLRDFTLTVDKALTGNGDIASELMVGSLQHSYAGRFDLVLTLSKPVEVVTKSYPKRKPKVEEIPAGRYLLDLKTSKGIYSTHYLQLEAYEAAAVECGYAPTDHRGVIHVTADGRYELALNKDWTFDDFLSVRQCFQTMNERGVVQALRDELDAKEVK